MDIRIDETTWNGAYVTSMPLPEFLAAEDGFYKYTHLSDKERKKTLTSIYKTCSDAMKTNEVSAPINTEVSQKEEGDTGGE